MSCQATDEVHTCSGTIEPGGRLEGLISFFALTPTATQCLSGLDTTAAITMMNGVAVSSPTDTLQIPYACTLVAPDLPTVTDGSCLDGVDTAPTITEAITENITYAYAPSPAEALATGGPLTVTASLEPGVIWGEVGDEWTVDGDTATTTVSIAAPPCLDLDKAVTSKSGAYWIGAIVRYQLVLTNTGTVPLTALTVTDPQAFWLDCDPATAGRQATVARIDPGSTVTCTAYAQVPVSMLGEGWFVNEASATGMAGDLTVTDTDSAQVRIWTPTGGIGAIIALLTQVLPSLPASLAS